MWRRLQRIAVQKISSYWAGKKMKKGSEARFLLSKNELVKLVSSIQESDFFTPVERKPRKYCFGCTGFAVAVTMDEKSHRCNLQYGFEKDEFVIRKLLVVFRTALEIISSPNDNKELEMLESGIYYNHTQPLLQQRRQKAAARYKMMRKIYGNLRPE